MLKNQFLKESEDRNIILNINSLKNQIFKRYEHEGQELESSIQKLVS